MKEIIIHCQKCFGRRFLCDGQCVKCGRRTSLAAHKGVKKKYKKTERCSLCRKKTKNIGLKCLSCLNKKSKKMFDKIIL